MTQEQENYWLGLFEKEELTEQETKDIDMLTDQFVAELDREVQEITSELT